MLDKAAALRRTHQAAAEQGAKVLRKKGSRVNASKRKLSSPNTASGSSPLSAPREPFYLRPYLCLKLNHTISFLAPRSRRFARQYLFAMKPLNLHPASLQDIASRPAPGFLRTPSRSSLSASQQHSKLRSSPSKAPLQALPPFPTSRSRLPRIPPVGGQHQLPPSKTSSAGQQPPQNLSANSLAASGGSSTGVPPLRDQPSPFTEALPASLRGAPPLPPHLAHMSTPVANVQHPREPVDFHVQGSLSPLSPILEDFPENPSSCRMAADCPPEGTDSDSSDTVSDEEHDPQVPCSGTADFFADDAGYNEYVPFEGALQSPPPSDHTSNKRAHPDEDDMSSSTSKRLRVENVSTKRRMETPPTNGPNADHAAKRIKISHATTLAATAGLSSGEQVTLSSPSQRRELTLEKRREYANTSATWRKYSTLR